MGPRARRRAAPDRAGQPTQNAYIKSFNGRFRDECLNEHWFTSLTHAEGVIQAWRHEYNEERPKKGLCRLTPADYRRQLTRCYAGQGGAETGAYAGSRVLHGHLARRL